MASPGLGCQYAPARLLVCLGLSRLVCCNENRMPSNRVPRDGTPRWHCTVPVDVIQGSWCKSGLLPEATIRRFGWVPPSEKAANMSKEGKTFVEDTFLAAAGKPDYTQLSQDLLDNYGIERSVPQLKQWWMDNASRLHGANI